MMAARPAVLVFRGLAWSEKWPGGARGWSIPSPATP